MAIRVLRQAALAVSVALLVLADGGVVTAERPAAAASNESRTTTEPVAATTAVTTAPGPPALNPSVGALFADGEHFCSASVVHSAAGDLVLTAAHCVNGGSGARYRAGISFAPGYHDGVAPSGMWTVTSAIVPDGWSSSSDPDLDFAFLTVHQAGNPHTVESVSGANSLGLDRGFVNQITLTGYPDTSDSPVVCRNTTTPFDTYQERVVCPGFPDGTSGGPWITDVNPQTGYGTVIGVIGGYELGGHSPDVSYSAYFDSDIQGLYESATRAPRPSE